MTFPLTFFGHPYTSSTIIPETFVALTSGSGTWTVPEGVTTLSEVIIIAGGGGGGSRNAGGGGGGAGGLIYLTDVSVTPGQSFSYTIGLGGAGGPSSPAGIQGSNGQNTVFGVHTAIGGGGGGAYGAGNGTGVGLNGGSGGGGAGDRIDGGASLAAGLGTVGQGNDGGLGPSSNLNQSAGGGGGAGAVGAAGLTSGNFRGGAGGNGTYFSSFLIYGPDGGWFAGGGGGGSFNPGTSREGGRGGFGGGGEAGTAGTHTGGDGAAGISGTGGGGGGSNSNGTTSRAGGTGGSGAVYIRYGTPTDLSAFPTQNITWPNNSGSPRIINSADNRIVYRTNASENVGWAKAANNSLNRTSGKLYFEVVYLAPTGSSAAVGTAPVNTAVTFGQGSTANANNGGRRLFFDDGRISNAAGTYLTYTTPWVKGDRIGVGVDFSTGQQRFWVNGVDKGVAYTGVTSGVPHACIYYKGAFATLEKVLYLPEGYSVWN